MPPTAGLPESDADAARAFAATLASDEHLLWAGRPDARRFARRDPRLIALGIFWTTVAGAGFWGFGSTALSDGYAGVALSLRMLLVVLAAAPFVAVGAFCLGGHVLLWRRVRGRTAYAITRRRVLVRRPALGYVGPDTLHELPRGEIGDVVVDDLRHDTGSLDIHDRRGVDEPLRFDDVRGADALAQFLQRDVQEASS